MVDEPPSSAVDWRAHMTHAATRSACDLCGETHADEDASLILVGDYSDGPVKYTITAATADGAPVEPDLADLFDLVLDRLGGSPCDE